MIQPSQATTTQTDRPPAGKETTMEEKTVTITITEREARMLYRACKSRAHHFLPKQTDDDEMYKIDRDVAFDYLNLSQAIIDQTNIKI